MSESPSQDVAVTTKNPNIIKRMYQWVLHWAETPYGTPALFGLSFAESSFFPIPPDVLQIALSISKPKRSFYYATVSAIASVLGAILGWYIGYALWAGGLEYFFLHYVPGVDKEGIGMVQDLYAAYGFMIILVAAFTPIPYKLFTITAGMGGNDQPASSHCRFDLWALCPVLPRGHVYLLLRAHGETLHRQVLRAGYHRFHDPPDRWFCAHQVRVALTTPVHMVSVLSCLLKGIIALNRDDYVWPGKWLVTVRFLRCQALLHHLLFLRNQRPRFEEPIDGRYDNEGE